MLRLETHERVHDLLEVAVYAHGLYPGAFSELTVRLTATCRGSVGMEDIH